VTLRLDTFVGRQRQAWLALLQVSHAVPTGWCIVGGQMVQLTCLERGFAPNRPTDDGDVALDVRARPTILKDFTEALTSIGFEADGTSPEGHQHRWVRNRRRSTSCYPAASGRERQQEPVRAEGRRWSRPALNKRSIVPRGCR
jgi:hypothetical protein